MARINTTDGSILNSNTCGTLRFTDDSYQTALSCSSNTSTICYFIAQNGSDSSDHMACKVDFTNTTQVSTADPDGDIHHSSITALDDESVVFGGFNAGSSPRQFLFIKNNFNDSSDSWKTGSEIFGSTYNFNSTRAMFSALNDDSNRLINIMQTDLAPIVILLNPADGSLIDAKKVEYNLTYSSGALQASGKVSNNTIMVSYVGYSPNVSPLVFINTETWELTSYLSRVFIVPSGFTPLFNTNQIIMLVQTSTPEYFTLQADYDKLNATELFEAATYTLSDVNSSFGFSEPHIPYTNAGEATNSLDPTLSDPTFATDANKTYDVTANIYSTSVATLEGNVSSTSLGPVEFDCYSVTTSPSSVNFSGQLSMTQGDEQAIPSWMTFNSSSATLSLSSPEVSSANYTVTNSLVGLFSNLTLDTNVIINITEVSSQENDEHCMGASSEGLCGFFVTLIIFGVLAPTIFIAILIYVKFFAPSGPSNMTKLDQEQPDEGNRGNENDNDVENDESVGMNQNNQAQPNMDNGTVQHAEQEFEENQV